MKEYKLVYLNKGIKMSREKDLEQAQEIINEYVAEGWELQQIVSPTIWQAHQLECFVKKNKSDNFQFGELPEGRCPKGWSLSGVWTVGPKTSAWSVQEI